MLTLDTTVKQVPAQRLYEKNGFRPVRRTVLAGFECIIYEKRSAGPHPREHKLGSPIRSDDVACVYPVGGRTWAPR